MKKITLLSLLLISAISTNAQDKKEEDKNSSEYNKWTVEATVGQGKGVKPYMTGYFSSDSRTFFGKPQANSLSLAGRYMFGPKFGIKLAFHYEDLKNIKNNESLPFEMQMMGISFQGVVNLNRLFGIEDNLKKFGLLGHAGIKVDRMTSKTENPTVTYNVPYSNHNYGRTEYNGGLVLGVSPQYRFSKKMAVLLDVTIQNNFRQHFNWDGSYSVESNNLNGQMVTTSLGLTYSLGKAEMHGDWAVIKDENLKKIEALDKKIGDIETQMNDTDKDGVPDYLDQENNSVAGVAVDTRGRMVDMNRNGVPDELERYVEKSTKETVEKSKEDAVLRLVNEGYVCAYYKSGKTEATDSSTEGIDFMLNFLRNHPGTIIDIIGHADELGKTETNNALALKRAENVKNILVKAGIDPSRLNTVSQGEDTSVAPDSEGARRLVRKVTFRVVNN
jgi:OmpA-OmpF porin, OOP family